MSIVPQVPLPTPKRPTRQTIPNIFRDVAEALVSELSEWDGTRPSDIEMSIGHVEMSLRQTGHHTNGYKLAKVLERLSWEPDLELVEALDCAFSYFYDFERVAVLAWVKDQDIQPALSVGSIVKTAHGTGPIVSIDSDMALYTVQTDEFLEKSPSQAGKEAGYLIAFENVEKL